MTTPPIPNAAPPIDIAKTVERARAAWAEGRADEAEIGLPAGAGGMAWPDGRDLSPRSHGLYVRQSGPRDRACAAGLRGAARPSGLFQRLRRDVPPEGAARRSRSGGRRAVALAPNFAAAWNNLGIVLQETLKLDESRLCLERALALEPNNAETLNNLANTLKRLGLAAEAEKRWRAALQLKPDYAEAYSNLSNLLLDQGEYDRAEGMARRAIELNPTARRRLCQSRRRRDRASSPR